MAIATLPNAVVGCEPSDEAEGGFVETTDLRGPEEHIPDAITNLVEPDVLLDERAARVEPPVSPPDAAFATHPPKLVLPGELDRRNRLGAGTR